MAEGEQFVERDLRGVRFSECDLSDVVMRGVEVAGMDIDAPWLSVGPGLRVNGVDVTPWVEQELDRRFPGRSERRAESPAGLRKAWTTVDQAWDAAIERQRRCPPGPSKSGIDDEWSFARHCAIWCTASTSAGKGVLGREEADFHPLGLGYGSRASEAGSCDDVLAARADRAAMVRDFLATVTDQVLDEDAATRTTPRTPRQCAIACT